MKRFYALNIITLLILMIIGCEKDLSLIPAMKFDESRISSDSVNPELIARELTDMNGWQFEGTTDDQDAARSLKKTPGLYVLNYQREHISGSIYHYKFQVKTGPDPYDIIGIHRVVKEKFFSLPIRTPRSIFFLHGDAKDFEGMALPGMRSVNTPDDFGFAVFLAENNVDVWGIDQAWTLVPEGVADLSFMSDWGLQRQVDDLNIGIAVARYARMFAGCGFDKMILSGYSSGVMTGFALLNEETQMPVPFRQVKGFIPVDLGVKFDDPYLKQFFSDYYFALTDLMNNGQYHEVISFNPLGRLAKNDPDGESPIMPGLTNLQAALFMGAGQIFGEGANFHYLAGILEEGFPVDLKLVTKEEWFDFLEEAAFYEPYLFEAEYAAFMTDAVEVPFDDHLSEIDVPIFNLAAAGGTGQLSIYGTTLLGSSDITHLIVSIGAPSLIEEFGHIDIFIAHDAERLVWRPVLRWIKTHTNTVASAENRNVVFDVE